MHKHFYASGFLYHLKTEQILLHQAHPNGTPSPWCMFSHLGTSGQNAQDTFALALSECMDVQLANDHIYPVYNYYSEDFGKDHYIFYAQVPRITPLLVRDNNTASWFTFKQITKILLSDQTKHDIMISERVIRAYAEGMPTQ